MKKIVNLEGEKCGLFKKVCRVGVFFFPRIIWFEKTFLHLQASVVQWQSSGFRSHKVASLNAAWSNLALNLVPNWKFGSKCDSNPRSCGHEATALSLHKKDFPRIPQIVPEFPEEIPTLLPTE